MGESIDKITILNKKYFYISSMWPKHQYMYVPVMVSMSVFHRVVDEIHKYFEYIFVPFDS